MLANMLVRSVTLQAVRCNRSVTSISVSTGSGVSVDSICDSPDGASSEHDFSVASNSVSTDAGKSVDTISDSPDVADSHRLSSGGAS
jgi:hypothetical protein